MPVVVQYIMCPASHLRLWSWAAARARAQGRRHRCSARASARSTSARSPGLAGTRPRPAPARGRTRPQPPDPERAPWRVTTARAARGADSAHALRLLRFIVIHCNVSRSSPRPSELTNQERGEAGLQTVVFWKINRVELDSVDISVPPCVSWYYTVLSFCSFIHI